MGGCVHWWSPTHREREVGVRQMYRTPGILGSSHWESICKVSTHPLLHKCYFLHRTLNMIYKLFFVEQWLEWTFVKGNLKQRATIVYKLTYCIRLHGSYEAIEGGQAMDALVDLTGGIPQLYEIQDKDPFLFRMIGKAQQKGAFITCSRKVELKHHLCV